MKTHKFARKAFYVDAVRVSESNIEEVAEWCHGTIKEGADGKFIQVKVHRPLTERQTQAYIGDWVLYAGTGFKVYVPKAFDKSFEKVKTFTKAQADEAGIKVPHEKSTKPTPAKKHPRPSPKNMPPRTGNNVGDALKAAQARAEEKSQDGVIAGHVMACHSKRNDPDWVCSCPKPAAIKIHIDPPKSAADIEADKLIAEVERIKQR